MRLPLPQQPINSPYQRTAKQAERELPSKQNGRSYKRET